MLRPLQSLVSTAEFLSHRQVLNDFNYFREVTQGEFDTEESHLLYYYLLTAKPLYIFNCGLGRGYTTYLIYKAISESSFEPPFTEIKSYDISQKALRNTRNFLKEEGLKITKDFAILDIKDVWRDGTPKKDYDFLFIDSEHTFEAAWSICKWLSCFLKPCVVWLHDNNSEEAYFMWKFIIYYGFDYIKVKDLFPDSKEANPSYVFYFDPNKYHERLLGSINDISNAQISSLLES